MSNCSKFITRRLSSSIAILALLGILAFHPQLLSATTFQVNDFADITDVLPGDGICATTFGTCTLRAAIQEANALAGSDTVVLPAGTYQLSIPGAGENNSATGDLDLIDAITIQGAAAASTIIDGGGLDRVFHLLGNKTTSIKNVTIRHGSAPSDAGGAICNGVPSGTSGLLELTDVVLADNIALFGGGILNGWGASVRFNGVTITGNKAAYGGGIYTRDFGRVSLLNSTVTGNIADSGGGGIDTFNNAIVSLQYVTIANNSASFGGGINSEAGTRVLSLTSTIVAQNSGNNCIGFITSLGYNISSDLSCVLSQSSDKLGVDPLLGPLQDNGGPTPTQALSPASVAVDSANPTACPRFDQRDVLRSQGGSTCDIGAYEYIPQ